MSPSSSPDMSPEMRLSLAASRQALGTGREGSEIPWREVEPEAVGQLSLRHRLGGVGETGVGGVGAVGRGEAVRG